MEELIDIYDRDGNRTGLTIPRVGAFLSEGQYMLYVLAITEDAEGRFLITQRAMDKHWAAGWWEVSGGGVRAEVVESDLPNLTDGQAVEITPEGDPSKVYVGSVMRRAAVFGARKLASDDPSQRTDERVVEVVASAGDAPLLIGQRVLVKFMKPGETAGAKREAATGVGPDRAMVRPQ